MASVFSIVKNTETLSETFTLLNTGDSPENNSWLGNTKLITYFDIWKYWSNYRNSFKFMNSVSYDSVRLRKTISFSNIILWDNFMCLHQQFIFYDTGSVQRVMLLFLTLLPKLKSLLKGDLLLLFSYSHEKIYTCLCFFSCHHWD